MHEGAVLPRQTVRKRLQACFAPPSDDNVEAMGDEDAGKCRADAR